MKKGHKIALVAVVSAVLVLAVGIGLAVAQSNGGQPQSETQTQAGPGGGPGVRGMRFKGRMIAGQVTKVDKNSISLKTHSGQDRMVQVNGQTRYVKKGGNSSLSDVKAGEKVAIMLDGNSGPGKLIAKVVLIGAPFGAKHPPLAGQITAINGNKVTIHTANGDKTVTIPSLSVGMKIGVMTGPDGSARGVIFNPPAKPAGAPQASAPGGPQRQGPAAFLVPGPGASAGQGA